LPRSSASRVRETLLDRIASELGLDPVELRRRNLITLAEQPCHLLGGPTLEGVTSRETLELAVEQIGYADFRERQRRARTDGRLLGIGFSTYIEPAPGPPDYWP
jgi:carbon-monoxide dehydrogenase large subunit